MPEVGGNKGRTIRRLRPGAPTRPSKRRPRQAAAKAERPWCDGGPGTPALPGEPCRTPPHPEWSEPEKWAWEQFCQGEVADFNERYGKTLDAKKEEDWNEEEKERRGLTSKFLRTILTGEPWKKSITEKGVRICGAYFAEEVDLGQAGPIDLLWLNESRLERGFTAFDLKVAGVLSLDGTWLGGKLKLPRARVDNSLFLRKASFREDVTFRRTQVGGYLLMKGAIFEGMLDMESLAVGGALLMDAGAVFKGEVKLQGAKVGGQLVMSGGTFEKKLDIQTISVGTDLFMRNATFIEPVRLAFAKISGDLLLEDVKCPALDLRGTQAVGVSCRRDDWPQDLELDRFTYGHLGGMGEEYAGDHMTSWPASWFINWLSRQKDYSPQPYEQCAKVLREAGQAGKADAVLFAGKVRERKEACKHNKWRWAGLWVLQAFIGHGLGAYMFLSLIWVLGLALAGTYVIHQWPPAQPGLGWLASLAYSLDMLLPFVKVAKAHESIVPTGWAAFYFYFHKLMGWLLGFFVVAGLTGLTKRS